jgi:hypothetical protein
LARRTFRTEPFSSSFKSKKGLDEFFSFRYGHTLASYGYIVNKGLASMETPDFAFVNFSADDHGAENCFIQDSGIDRSAHQCCGHAMAPTESNLQLVVGIDPNLREFRQGIK